MNENVGVISMGIKTPIIREGDDLATIVVDSVLNATKMGEKMVQPSPNVKGLVNVPGEFFYNINHKDVIGITESVVARAQGNYVTVDEIAVDIIKKFGAAPVITVIKPIYSRNRFSMILKGIARAASKIIFDMPEFDEVGNPRGVNPFTGVDIMKYYKEICKNENCKCEFIDTSYPYQSTPDTTNWLYCGLHDFKEWKEHSQYFCNDKRFTLADICSDKCEYGLLGSNKATEEKLKLFPNKEKAQKLVKEIQRRISEKTGKIIYVCVYGDGCFKDAVGGIWEFADPVTMPAYTNPEIFESTPNEIKIKYLADNKYGKLKGKELDDAINKEIELYKGINLKGNMTSEGTTPRLYRDLLASLMDLTTGSGMRATPIVLIKNYF